MNKYNLSFTDVINNMDNYKIGTIIESENGNQYKIIHTDCNCKRPSRIDNTGLRFMTYNNTKVMFRIVENEEKLGLKEDEPYYFYDKDTESIKYSRWAWDDYDNIRLKNKVIFKTEAEAQRYADYMKAKEEYSYEFSKEEWEDGDSPKSYIYYDYEDKTIRMSSSYIYKYLGILYFKTKDQAQEFIDKYKAEILEFEFGIKED